MAKKLICKNCKEEVTVCDYCEGKFQEGDLILCCYIDGYEYHFCCVSCYRDFLNENLTIDESEVIKER